MIHLRSCPRASGLVCAGGEAAITRHIVVSASRRPDMPEVMDRARDVRHMRRRRRCGHTRGMPNITFDSLRYTLRALLIATGIVAGSAISGALPASAQAPQ